MVQRRNPKGNEKFSGWDGNENTAKVVIDMIFSVETEKAFGKFNIHF